MPEPVLAFAKSGVTSFEEIPHQMVCFGELNKGNVNPLALFCLIPCPSDKIMSVRWGSSVKGVWGKPFRNSIIIDIKHRGNKQHTKLFYTKGSVHMSGVNSLDDAKTIVKLLCDIFRDVNNRILWLRENREKVREAFEWLTNNSVGKPHEVLSYYDIKNDDKLGDVRVCKRHIENSLKLPVSVPEEYVEVIDFFKAVSSDLLGENLSHVALKNRLKTLMKLKPFKTEYSLKDVKCSGIIHKFTLGFIIDRYKTDLKLREAGFDSYYENVSGANVIVHITSDLEFDASKLRRKDISGKETFTFNPHGVVTHCGCVDYMMEDNYNKIMNYLFSIKDEIKLAN